MSDYQTLKNISILFFTFVLIMFLVNIFTKNHYERSNNQVVDLVKEKDYLLGYDQLHKILSATENHVYTFVDLRPADDFNKGHLKGAINIPFDLVLENKQQIRDILPGIPVLYSNNESEAHIARMLLISAGMDASLRVAPGSYETILAYATENFDPSYAAYREDKATFDYPRYMQVQPASEREKENTNDEVPDVKIVTTSVQGGC